jgi:putative glycosyl hydrolase-like family 6 (GHL6) protein/glycosyl hydrolase family 42 (putative beta-galactosidase)
MHTHDSLSRRGFLKTVAAAGGAGVALCNLELSLPAQEGPATASPAWVDRAMRWAQLTLVEDDPGKFDPQFWLDYFQRTHSDAVCLSAGGCVAYYPTQVPFHHRSAWLRDSDPFGALVAGCRKLGMVVIARTDPHATYDDVHDAHPDWIAVDSSGKPRRHWASPEMWVTCALGPYNFEFMTEVKKEIMTRYRVDGIFINRWDGSGMCYCEHCRANFKQATGFELPVTNDPRDAARRAYILWRQQRLFDLWRLWDGAIRRINPDARVIPNTGGGATSSLDMKKIGELADTLFADRQARRGLAAPWANGKNGKEFRATMGRKPIVGIFSVGLEEPYRWKDSVQSEAEIRIWVADGVANGLRPWFTKFSGTLHDERWLKPVQEIYSRYHRWEKYLRNEVPLARVALVYSQQTAWFYGQDRPRDKIEDPTLGWYQALIEARIPFEMVHDRLLDPAQLRQFKTLILPNIAALSDEQCAQLEQFVEQGGGLIATYETSLCNEWGEPRKDFGLNKLFGVTFKGQPEGPLHNSYLRLDQSAPHAAVLLKDLDDAPRIVNGVWRLNVEPAEPSSAAPLTLIPSYPDLPMEKVYPRMAKTDIAEVFLRERRKGRVVYFPWDIDRTFWDVLCVDHGKLLANAVHWATNEPPPVVVTGPGVLDITVWRQKNSMTVHLVNLTNPMMMKGPFRELLPVGEQKVRVRLPDGTRPGKVTLLAANQTPHVAHAGSELVVTTSSILDHEILAIDFKT